MVVLHLPSIIAFGFDENLERHGPIVTSAGLVADYFVWAALLMLLARSLRAIARRSDRARSSDPIHGRSS